MSPSLFLLPLSVFLALTFWQSPGQLSYTLPFGLNSDETFWARIIAWVMSYPSHRLLEVQDRPSPDEGRVGKSLSAIRADMHSHAHRLHQSPSLSLQDLHVPLQSMCSVLALVLLNILLNIWGELMNKDSTIYVGRTQPGGLLEWRMQF